MPLLENLETQGNHLFRHRGTLPLIMVSFALLLSYSFKPLTIATHTSWFRYYEIACLLIAITGLIVRKLTIGIHLKGLLAEIQIGR